ncbi:4421_t:CDS:2, partial [Cetraspora pellucida]
IISAFVPQQRAEHSAVLVAKKLYFQGGYDHTYNVYVNSQLFYLDVSNSFNTTNINLMPWTDLSSTPGLTNKTGATACVDGGAIFYIGGTHSGNLVSKFDTVLGQWNELNTYGSIPTPGLIANEEIKFVQCVILGHKIYIYGGYGVYQMNILDSLQLYWSRFSSALTYSGTQGYTATMLNDSILYMGGGGINLTYCQANSTNELPVSIFNTSDNSWRMVPTSGQAPLARCDHSSVYISQHNRILLFYGTNNNISIYALDTLTFTWSIPKILNSGGSVQILTHHTSTLIGSYILIAFGLYINSGLGSSDVFLLDVSHYDNYKWETTYDPAKLFQPAPTQTIGSSSTLNNQQNINIVVIIGEVIGGISGLILLSTAAIIIIYIVKKKYQINVDTLQDQITNQQPVDML